MDSPKTLALALLEQALAGIKNSCQDGLGLYEIYLEELLHLAALFNLQPLLDQALAYTKNTANFSNSQKGAFTTLPPPTTAQEEESRTRMLQIPTKAILQQEYPPYNQQEIGKRILDWTPLTKTLQEEAVLPASLSMLEIREVACAYLIQHNFEKASQLEPYLQQHPAAYADYTLVKVIELYRTQQWPKALALYQKEWAALVAASVPLQLLLAKAFLDLLPWEVYPYSDDEYN